MKHHDYEFSGGPLCGTVQNHPAIPIGSKLIVPEVGVRLLIGDTNNAPPPTHHIYQCEEGLVLAYKGIQS